MKAEDVEKKWQKRWDKTMYHKRHGKPGLPTRIKLLQAIKEDLADNSLMGQLRLECDLTAYKKEVEREKDFLAWIEVTGCELAAASSIGLSNVHI